MNARTAALAEADRIARRSAADHAWFRWHGQAEYARGWQEGYEARAAALKADWHAVADQVAAGGPSFAELERRRWGSGGRERFADPRPGDYRGQGGGAA